MRDDTTRMPTERRLSARKRCSAEVYLIWPGERPARHRATDVSNSGIFVETGPRYITRGARLQLVLVVKRGSLRRLYRLPATVARVTRGGAGLCIDRTGRRAQTQQRPA